MTSRRASRRDRPPPSRTASAVVGDNIIAVGTGETFEAKPHAAPPTKEAGRHRWVVTCTYTVTDDIAATAQDPNTVKYLDHENLMFVGIGCIDCEQLLGTHLGGVEVGSHCPAGDEWTT